MSGVAGYHVTVTIETSGFTDEQLQRAYDGLGRGHAGWHDSTETLRLSQYIPDDDLRAAATSGMDIILTSFARSGIEGEIVSMQVGRHDQEAIDQGLRRAWQEIFIGTAETAELLGVSKQRVSELAKTHAEFPKPIKRLKSGPVYDRVEMVEWEKSWERRRTGRPPKEPTMGK